MHGFSAIIGVRGAFELQDLLIFIDSLARSERVDFTVPPGSGIDVLTRILRRLHDLVAKSLVSYYRPPATPWFPVAVSAIRAS